ncbi:MAG TPA: hypothetical protein VI504_15160 [Candidatus Eisenbacteria bacterium]|jgi:hypothetical protein
MAKPTHADAELLLHLYEIRREPELRRSRAWLLTEFKSTTWAEVKSRYLSHTDEDRWFRMATSYWEMAATMVNRGTLHAELFFDHTGEDIATWERIKGVIPDARADIRPTYLMQFEKLVAAHQAYRKKTNAAAVGGARGPAAAPRAGARKSRR